MSLMIAVCGDNLYLCAMTYWWETLFNRSSMMVGGICVCGGWTCDNMEAETKTKAIQTKLGLDSS